MRGSEVSKIPFGFKLFTLLNKVSVQCNFVLCENTVENGSLDYTVPPALLIQLKTNPPHPPSPRKKTNPPFRETTGKKFFLFFFGSEAETCCSRCVSRARGPKRVSLIEPSVPCWLMWEKCAASKAECSATIFSTRSKRTILCICRFFVYSKPCD